MEQILQKVTIGTNKKLPYKTGDLLKEVKFLRNILLQHKKNGDLLIQVTA